MWSRYHSYCRRPMKEVPTKFGVIKNRSNRRNFKTQQANMKIERSSMSMTLDLNSGTLFWLLFCDILTTLLKRFKTITSLPLCTGMSSEQSIYLLLYRNGCLVIFFHKHLSRNGWLFQKVNYVLIYTLVICVGK